MSYKNTANVHRTENIEKVAMVDAAALSQNLQEAEESLRQLCKSAITELLALQRPPESVIQVFTGLTILLTPSSSFSDWQQTRKWLAANKMSLLTLLINFDKDNITDEQLARLNTILAKEECQPTRLMKCSRAAYSLCQWLRAMAYFAQAKKALRQEP